MKRCNCRCHSSARASYHAALQHGRWPDIQDAKQDPLLNVPPSVPGDDVIAAALACPACLANHCDALSLRTIWSERHVADPTAWTDPPAPPPDTGEGPET